MNAFAAATLGLFGVTATPYLAFLQLYAWVRPEDSPAAKEPSVNIVLSPYNEERTIQAKLDDLLKLNITMAKAELVVCDASTNEAGLGSTRIGYNYLDDIL